MVQTVTLLFAFHFEPMEEQILFAGGTLIFVIFCFKRNTLYFFNFELIFCSLQAFSFSCTHLLKSRCNEFAMTLVFEIANLAVVFMNDPVYGNHTWLFFLITLLCFLCLSHVFNAQRGHKVDSFPDVEILGKPAVVCFEESANIISGLLIGFVNWNASINEF